MTTADISGNLVSIILFLSVFAGGLFSFLAEHWKWFSVDKQGNDRSPFFKRAVVTAITVVIGVVVTALGSSIDPAQAATLNGPITAVVAFLAALLSTVVTHGGLNQLLPAIIDLLRALAEYRKVGPNG